MREAATYHGIRVDKWLGDGAMLVGVESPAVLAAVVEAKWALDGHSILALRGGIAAGPVMVFEGDDYVGGAVNLAAKLCDLAAPGHASRRPRWRRPVQSAWRQRLIGAVQVPGFHRPMELVAVDASADEAGGHRRGLGAALGRTMRDVTGGDAA